MNESERSELESLKQRHARLEQELARLGEQLQRVESQISQSASAALAAEPQLEQFPAPEIPPESAVPPIISSAPKPPPLAPVLAAPMAAPLPKPAEVLKPPQPTPPPPVAAAVPSPLISTPAKLFAAALEQRASEPPKPPPVPPPPRPSSPPPREPSLEMRVGTYWLVRIGIVMLLTGLVFFGNYAYQNYIGKLSPAGKVSLLYLASGALLGAGAWWQAKAAKESLRNYGQVLFAGGLAAVYFTTYAAHHLDTLRVINSAQLDGLLLLIWAGFMVWVADRKKSEVLALFAVGLAYYTSIITRIGYFTLYSNLVLTIAAVFFLVRNRWSKLSFSSLVATYAAYAFWRFFNGEQWHWASPDEGLWFGTYFLISYWIVFTAAVFLSKHPAFEGVNRATFLTINNSEFFVMFLLTMIQVHHGGFWKFSLGYGAVLIGLAEAARRFLPAEPPATNSYLTQGLLLVTVGLIAKFTGLKLALLLGAESIVLLTLASMRKGLVLEIGAHIAGVLAVVWGIDGLERDDSRALWLAVAVGAMMAFNAFWAHRRDPAEKKLWVRPSVTVFTLLALAIWLGATWYNTSVEIFPLALAGEALVLTLSIYALGIPEVVLFGQGYLLIAQVAWLIRFSEPRIAPPWWNPIVLMAITLALSHWWQRQKKVFAKYVELSQFWQGAGALALVAILYFWLSPTVEAPEWLALTSGLAIVITIYGVFTRAWLLAAFGQIFLLVSAGQFVLQLSDHKPEWYFPVAPMIALVALSLATVQWFRQRPGTNPMVQNSLLQLALIYRWVALVMSLWWVIRYIPAPEQIWVFALLNVLAFAWAGWRRNSEALLVAAVFAVAGFALFWIPAPDGLTLYWPNLAAILALLGQQQVARRLPDRYPLPPPAVPAMIVLGGLSLWLYLTCWICNEEKSYRLVFHHEGGVYLTAGWSVLALVLFGCGIALRERVYRWLGLGVLACALGRVVLFDVWRLETIYRILSFMALGMVLLVLGFFYNKYQEKIKEWL